MIEYDKYFRGRKEIRKITLFHLTFSAFFLLPSFLKYLFLQKCIKISRFCCIVFLSPPFHFPSFIFVLFLLLIRSYYMDKLGKFD